MADGYEFAYRSPVPHHRQLPYHLQQEQQRKQYDERQEQRQQQHVQHYQLKAYQDRQPEELFVHRETASPFLQDQRALPVLLRLDDGSDADMGKAFMDMPLFARQPPSRPVPPPPPRAPPSPPVPTSPARPAQIDGHALASSEAAELVERLGRSRGSKSPPRDPYQDAILVSSSSPEVALLHAGSSSSTSSRPTSASVGYERSDGPGSSDTEASLLYGQTSDTEPEVGPFTPKTPTTPALPPPTVTSASTTIREYGWKPRELRLVDRQKEASSNRDADAPESYPSAKERRRKASEAKPPFRIAATAESVGLGIEFAAPPSSNSSISSSTPDPSAIAGPSSRKHGLKPLNLAGGSPSPVPASSPMFSSLSAVNGAASHSPRFPSSPHQGLGLTLSSDHADSPRRPSREAPVSDEGRTGRWSPLLVLPRSPAFASGGFGSTNAASRPSFSRPRATSTTTSADTEHSFNATTYAQGACHESLRGNKKAEEDDAPEPRARSSFTPSEHSVYDQSNSSEGFRDPTQGAVDLAGSLPLASNRTSMTSNPATSEGSMRASSDLDEAQSERSSSWRKTPPPSLTFHSPTSPQDAPSPLSASSSLPMVTPPALSPTADTSIDSGNELNPPTSVQRQDSISLLPPAREDVSPLSSPALSAYHDSLSSPVKERRGVSPSTSVGPQDDVPAEQEDQSDESAKTPRFSVAVFPAVPNDEPPPTPYFEIEPAPYIDDDAAETSSASDYGEDPSYLPRIENDGLPLPYASEPQEAKQGEELSNEEIVEDSSESADPDGSYDKSRPGIPLIFRQMLRESTPQATGWESYSLTAIETSNSMSSLASAEEVLRFASESEGVSPAPSQSDASPFHFDLSPASELAPSSSMPFDVSPAASEVTSSSSMPLDHDFTADHQAFEFDNDEAPADQDVGAAAHLAEEDEGDETPVIVQSELAFQSNDQDAIAVSPDDTGSERSSLPSDPSFAEALNQALSSFDGSDTTPTSVRLSRAPGDSRDSVEAARKGALARSSALMFVAPPERSESSGALRERKEPRSSAAIVGDEEAKGHADDAIRSNLLAPHHDAQEDVEESPAVAVAGETMTSSGTETKPDELVDRAASDRGFEEAQVDQPPLKVQAQARNLEEAGADQSADTAPPARSERLGSVPLRCDSPEAMEDDAEPPNSSEDEVAAKQVADPSLEDLPEARVERSEDNASSDRRSPAFDTGIFVQRGRAGSLTSDQAVAHPEEPAALAESPKAIRSMLSKDRQQELQSVLASPVGAVIPSSRLSANGIDIIAQRGVPATGGGALPTLGLRSIEKRNPKRPNRPNLRVDTASPPVPELFEDRQDHGWPETRKADSGEGSSGIPGASAMNSSSKPLPPTPTAAAFDVAPARTNVIPRSAPLPQGPFAGAAMRRPEADAYMARQPASHWSSGSESEDDSSKRLSAKKRRSGSTRKRSSSAAPPPNRASFAAQAGMANQPLPSPSVATRKGLLQVLRKKSFNNLGLASAERDSIRESSPGTPGLDSPALPRVSMAADGFPFPGMSAGKSPFPTNGNMDSTGPSSLSARPSLAVRSHSKQVSSISIMRGPSLMHKQSSSSLRTEVSNASTGGGAASTTMTDREINSHHSAVSPPTSPRKARNSSTFPPPLPNPTRGRSKSFTAPQSLLTLQRIGSQGLPPLPTQPQSPGLKDFLQLKHASFNGNQPDLATRARSASTVGTSPSISRSSKLFSKAAGSGIMSRKLSRSSLSSQAAIGEPIPPLSDLRSQPLQRDNNVSFNGLTPLTEATATPSSTEGDLTPIVSDRPAPIERTSTSPAQDEGSSTSGTDLITTPKRSNAIRRASQASGAGSSPERVRADPPLFSLDNGANPMSPRNMQALLAMASSPDTLQRSQIAGEPVDVPPRNRSRHVVKKKKLQRLKRTEGAIAHYPSLTDLGRLWQAEHPNESLVLADAVPVFSATMRSTYGNNGSTGFRGQATNDNTAGLPSRSGSGRTQGAQNTNGAFGTGSSGGAGPPGGGGNGPNNLSQDDDIAADQVSSSEESEDDYGEDESASDDTDNSDDVPLGARMNDVASLQRRLTHQNRQQLAGAPQLSSDARPANLAAPGPSALSPDDLIDRLRQVQVRQTNRTDVEAARRGSEARNTANLPSLGSVMSDRPTNETDSDKAEKLRRARSLANRHRPSAVSTAKTSILPLTSPARPYDRDSGATHSETGRNSTAAASLAALKARVSVSESHAAAAMRASLAATSNPAMAAAAVAFATKEAQAGRIAMSEIPERATAIALENTLSGGVTATSVTRSKSLASKGASPDLNSRPAQREAVTSPQAAGPRVLDEPVQRLMAGSGDLPEIATEEAPVRRGSSIRQRPAGVDLRLGTTLLPSASSPPPSSAAGVTLSPPASAVSDGRSQSTTTSRAPTRANSVARSSRGVAGSSVDQATLPTVPKVQRTVFIINRQRFIQCQVALDARARDLVIDVLNREPLQAVPGRGGWALFEVSPALAIERPLREYELIEAVAEGGTNHSQDFLLLKQTELTPSLSVRAVLASSPTLAGYVYIRDRRLKWTKRWLELRDHSLFHYKSEKGKEETLLCRLSSFDIYLVDATSSSSSLKAPKAHSFALRAQKSRSAREGENHEEEQVHYCSLSDPSAHRDWVKACLNARTYVLRQEQPQLFQLPPLPSAAVEEANGSHIGGQERGGMAPLIQRDTNRDGQAHVSTYPGKEQASIISRGAGPISGPFEKGSLLAAQAMKDQSSQQGMQGPQKSRWPRAGAALDQMHRLTKSPPM